MGKSKKVETVRPEAALPSKTRSSRTPKPKATGDSESKQPDLVSRCSPQYFMKIISQIKPIIGLKHLEGLKKTPFYHFFNMTQQNTSFIRVEALLKRFNTKKFSFTFGDDIEVPFVAADFSLVLGLHEKGQGVNESLKLESSTVDRLFDGKLGNVKRKVIGEKLIKIVKKDSNNDLDDFCRLYILLVFNCLLFPTSNYWTPRFLLPYVDDLTRINLYAWGEAAYNFLVNEIRYHLGEGGYGEKKKYLDGCTLGLMSWLYELVPSLGTHTSLNSFPRFTRWGESKLPNNEKAAEAKLANITREKILPLYPTHEEQALLEPILPSVGTTLITSCLPSQMVEVKMRLKAQEDEIIALRKVIEALQPAEGKRKREEETIRQYKRRGVKKLKVESRQPLEESALQLYFHSPEPLRMENAEEEEKVEKEGEEGKPVTQEMYEEKAEDDGEGRGGAEAEEKDEEEEKVEENAEEEEKVEKEKKQEKKDEEEKEDDGEEEKAGEEIVLVGNGGDDEKGGEEKKYGGDDEGDVDEGNAEKEENEEEGKDGEGPDREKKEEGMAEEGDEVKNVWGEEMGETEGLNEKEQIAVATLMSSIVQSVHNRDDRIPKKKDPDFVTPPTITPDAKEVVRGRGRGRRGRGRGRGKAPEFPDQPALSVVEFVEPLEVQDDCSSSSSNELRMLEAVRKYRNRDDFRGRDLISMKEQQVIEAYLYLDKLADPVWEGEGNVVEGRFMCELMFGETLVGDLLDAWMLILRSPTYREKCSHSIFGMSTIVQAEILERTKDIQIINISDENWPTFMDGFSETSLSLLEEMATYKVMENCRYVLFPVNTDFHWFLLALDVRTRMVAYMNSINNPTHMVVARTIIAFYNKYLRLGLGYRLDENLYPKKKCRQQKGNVDCGVFVCLWSECYAKDTSEFWSYAKTVDLDKYRAEMAHTILTHEHSRFRLH